MSEAIDVADVPVSPALIKVLIESMLGRLDGLVKAPFAPEVQFLSHDNPVEELLSGQKLVFRVTIGKMPL